MEKKEKLISIDLAIRQTGIAVFTGRHLDATATIEHTLGALYNPIDVVSLKKAFSDANGIGKYLNKDARIIIEFNTQVRSTKLLMFAVEVKGYLLGQGYDVLMLNANHWMSIADRMLALKRNHWASGRENNKLWLKALSEHLFPNWKFNSQDEIDATIMGVAYMVSPSSF